MTEMTCSYLSSFNGQHYSHGLCLWAGSPIPHVSVCYCESGYECSAPTGFTIPSGSIEPVACKPEAKSLLSLMEREIQYVDVACELVRNRQLDAGAAVAAIDACAQRLERLRNGLQAWHSLNTEPQAESKELVAHAPSAQASKSSKRSAKKRAAKEKGTAKRKKTESKKTESKQRKQTKKAKKRG